MTTYLPQPTNPPVAVQRTRCGTPNARCAGDIRLFAAGFRCRWVNRHLRAVTS